MIGSGGNGSVAQVASVVGNYSSMSYCRDQELEYGDFGVRLMIEAGYDAKNLIGVIYILEEASGGTKSPEFQSSHPSPENRRQKILESIENYSVEPQWFPKFLSSLFFTLVIQLSIFYKVSSQL